MCINVKLYAGAFFFQSGCFDFMPEHRDVHEWPSFPVKVDNPCSAIEKFHLSICYSMKTIHKSIPSKKFHSFLMWALMIHSMNPMYIREF